MHFARYQSISVALEGSCQSMVYRSMTAAVVLLTRIYLSDFNGHNNNFNPFS